MQRRVNTGGRMFPWLPSQRVVLAPRDLPSPIERVLARMTQIPLQGPIQRNIAAMEPLPAEGLIRSDIKHVWIHGHVTIAPAGGLVLPDNPYRYRFVIQNITPASNVSILLGDGDIAYGSGIVLVPFGTIVGNPPDAYTGPIWADPQAIQSEITFTYQDRRGAF